MHEQLSVSSGVLDLSKYHITKLAFTTSYRIVELSIVMHTGAMKTTFLVFLCFVASRCPCFEGIIVLTSLNPCDNSIML